MTIITKKFKVIAAALLIVPAIGFAQVNPEKSTTPMKDQSEMTQQKDMTPQAVAEKQTTWMHENLALTPEQLEEVQDINLKFAEKSEKIINSDEEKADKLEDINENIEEQREEFQDLLTPEQYSKFEQTHKMWTDQVKARVSSVMSESDNGIGDSKK